MTIDNRLGDFDRFYQPETIKASIKDRRLACINRAAELATKKLKKALTFMPDIDAGIVEPKNTPLVETARQKVNNAYEQLGDAGMADVFIFPGKRRLSPVVNNPENAPIDESVIDLNQWRKQAEQQYGHYGYEHTKDDPLIIINKLLGQPVEIDDYQRLVCQEAKIGGSIFGDLQPNQQRYFFCLDDRTWIWHEQGSEPDFKLTTKYSFDLNGITKSIDNGQTWQTLSTNETASLLEATRVYHQKVTEKIYNQA